MSDPHNWPGGSAPYYAPPPPYSEKEPPGGPDPRYTPVEPTAPIDHGAVVPPMPNQHQPFCGVPAEEPIQPPEVPSNDQPANVPNYLCYAICTMFCCLPLGTAALVYALLTRESNLNGNITAAQRTSKMARMFATIALGVGLAFATLYIIMVAVLIYTNT